MSRATGIAAGTVTAAFPVATFTAAVTSSSAPSLFSTRAAQAAHVIPLIDSSTSRNPAADATPVIAADIKSYLPAGKRPASPRAEDSAAPGNIHRPINRRPCGKGTLATPLLKPVTGRRPQYPARVNGSSRNTRTRYQEYPARVNKYPRPVYRRA